MPDQFSTMYEAPFGPLFIVTGTESVREISFAHMKTCRFPPLPLKKTKDYSHEVVTQLKEYFAGRRQVFELNLEPCGTPFQLSVWSALLKIPYAKTCSYMDIALEIGNYKSVRAVGQALKANPLPLVVPCHRVIGKSGHLTGFNGGLHIKSWLIEFEKNMLSRTLTGKSQSPPPGLTSRQ